MHILRATNPLIRTCTLASFKKKKDYHIYCTHLCAPSQELRDAAPYRLPVLGANYSLMTPSVSRKLLQCHVLRLQSRPINKAHEASKYCVWNTFLWYLNQLQRRWQLNYFLTVYIASPPPKWWIALKCDGWMRDSWWNGSLVLGATLNWHTYSPPHPSFLPSNVT